MVNNITNIKKKKKPSPQIIEYKTRIWHRALEIQVLAWNSHNNVVGISHFDNRISNVSLCINKRLKNPALTVGSLPLKNTRHEHKN